MAEEIEEEEEEEKEEEEVEEEENMEEGEEEEEKEKEEDEEKEKEKEKEVEEEEKKEEEKKEEEKEEDKEIEEEEEEEEKEEEGNLSKEEIAKGTNEKEHNRDTSKPDKRKNQCIQEGNTAVIFEECVAKQMKNETRGADKNCVSPTQNPSFEREKTEEDESRSQNEPCTSQIITFSANEEHSNQPESNDGHLYLSSLHPSVYDQSCSNPASEALTYSEQTREVAVEGRKGLVKETKDRVNLETPEEIERVEASQSYSSALLLPKKLKEHSASLQTYSSKRMPPTEHEDDLSAECDGSGVRAPKKLEECNVAIKHYSSKLLLPKKLKEHSEALQCYTSECMPPKKLEEDDISTDCDGSAVCDKASDNTITTCNNALTACDERSHVRGARGKGVHKSLSAKGHILVDLLTSSVESRVGHSRQGEGEEEEGEEGEGGPPLTAVSSLSLSLSLSLHYDLFLSVVVELPVSMQICTLLKQLISIFVSKIQCSRQLI